MIRLGEIVSLISIQDQFALTNRLDLEFYEDLIVYVDLVDESDEQKAWYFLTYSI